MAAFFLVRAVLRSTSHSGCIRPRSALPRPLTRTRYLPIPLLTCRNGTH
jgi:hypothetical protein